MRSSRAAIASVLALALPVLLLAGGWLWSSLRERDARLAEERARLVSGLDRARSAVDAGLRELAAREDERPFYVYSHYYSPPDVLALNDPVAISPLAAETGDPRIVGHFELDPDGTFRTPYSVDPGPVTERAARVLGSLDDDARAALLRELGGASAGALITSAPEVVQPLTPRPVRRDAGAPDAGAVIDNPLAQVGNFIATDITQAQSGDVEAYERVQSRGRVIPRVARRDVSLDTIAPQIAPQESAALRPSPRPVAPPAPALPPLVQGEIEVDYTPMALRVFGATWVLARVVSHQEERVLDGVVLDRARITEGWVPETIARAVQEDAPSVVSSDAMASECAARAPASDLLPDVVLCAPIAPLTRAQHALDRALWLEIAMLVGLLALTALAAALMLRAGQRAAELARQQSAFVSAVSHELRTPLTTLRMHAEMLDEGLVSDERRAKVHAELVSESVRLARLVENVLEISRLEEGRRPLRASRGDLRTQVAAVVEAQRSHARGKGFELEVRSPDAPVELVFDAAAVEQIVTNAIDNALKYAASATDRRIEIALVRAARRGRPGVELRVRDHGPGIELAERERVFERFHRVERPETAHQPGTGLGLALVRELARAHHGDAIVLAADPGALLVVWLPLG